MISISNFLRKIAETPSVWQQAIQDKFGISCHSREPGSILDPLIIRQTYNTFNKIPTNLVKDCGVKKLYFSNTMGPNLQYYPNHGFYFHPDQSVTLNSDIFYHPDVMDDFFDYRGYFVSRPEQTLIHEFGHSFDANSGTLSMKPDWLNLSGWDKEPKPGLKRLVINQSGKPPMIGEWYYNPQAGFTRFYAKRNPEDDWADSFAFYVAGLSKLPPNKKQYFDTLLKKYY